MSVFRKIGLQRGLNSAPMPNFRPALRDQFGQEWAFPPFDSPEGDAPTAVWLIFLPGAYTPVCMKELAWIDSFARQLKSWDVGLRVIATDPVPVLRTVSHELNLSTPLLSDFWPHGAASQKFEAFDFTTGKPLRTSILINRNGDELFRQHAESERVPGELLDTTKRILHSVPDEIQ